MPLRTIKNGDSWPKSLARSAAQPTNQAPVAGSAVVQSFQCGGASRAKPADLGSNLQPIDADAPPKSRPSRGKSDRELVAELPVETAEGFRQHFGREPYYRENAHFEITRKTIKEHLEELEVPLFSDAEKAQLLDLHAQSRELAQKFEAVGFQALNHRISRMAVENETAIRAGNPPPNKPINRDEVLKQLDVDRRGLRDEGRALSIAAFNIWNKKVDLLKDLFRKLAVSYDETERAAAEHDGAPLEPSYRLRRLIHLALVGAESQRSSWHTTSMGFNARNVLWGILLDESEQKPATKE